VNGKDQGWLGARFARMSTGLKMLLILSAALLPLGILAVWASVHSAQEKNAQRRDELLARLEIKAQRLDAAFSRAVLTIGTASTAISSAPNSRAVCENTLRRLERGPVQGRYALYAAGAGLGCASEGFVVPGASLRARPGMRAEVTPDGKALRLWVFGESGALEGITEFDRQALTALTYIPGTTRNFDLDLVQAGRTMVLRREFEDGPLIRSYQGGERVAGGQMQLRMTLGVQRLGTVDFLMIVLPVLMWLAAAIIGWLILQRLLLRPLAMVQRAVSAYRPGDRDIALPNIASPAREIGDLGTAFDEVVQTVSRHEAELEAAVDRQTRLVREVHHRVKNNLQVVASLLNLHARGAANEQVAAAYASIQRRVDALAVVHRNHYAELEENRGVSLKSLISELAANLRATAPSAASAMTIRLDLGAYYASQDVAVSVAFLVTEIAEHAMLCGAGSVAIALDQGEAPGTAMLILESDSLRRDTPCEESLTDRFQRIVTGLSRQLRSTLSRDETEGRYSLAIAIIGKG